MARFENQGPGGRPQHRNAVTPALLLEFAVDLRAWHDRLGDVSGDLINRGAPVIVVPMPLHSNSSSLGLPYQA